MCFTDAIPPTTPDNKNLFSLLFDSNSLSVCNLSEKVSMSWRYNHDFSDHSGPEYSDCSYTSDEENYTFPLTDPVSSVYRNSIFVQELSSKNPV